MIVIGLMSGTSADGVDAAVVEWPEGEPTTPFRLLAHWESPFPGELQARIHKLAAGEVPGPDALRELADLNVLLAERFADAAIEGARAAGVSLEQVSAIASHGQTVAHHPELHATLQIGDPSLIAVRTGCTTVANFRTRDIALGGQGAPLAPFFHHAAFSCRDENRVALNLGGIANLTWLPGTQDPDAVIAFDVGPANSLLDGVVSTLTAGRERFDRDGARALRGEVQQELLDELLDDDFLERLPPKSTGRERYGSEEAKALAARAVEIGIDDLAATLVAFTCEAIGRACRDLLPREDPAAKDLQRLLVGGGGAANPAVMAALKRALPGTAVETFAAHGVPIQAAEAMAFSLMGRNAILGIPNHLPRCTGASQAGVLGEISPGRGLRPSQTPRP